MFLYRYAWHNASIDAHVRDTHLAVVMHALSNETYQSYDSVCIPIYGMHRTFICSALTLYIKRVLPLSTHTLLLILVGRAGRCCISCMTCCASAVCSRCLWKLVARAASCRSNLWRVYHRHLNCMCKTPVRYTHRVYIYKYVWMCIYSLLLFSFIDLCAVMNLCHNGTCAALKLCTIACPGVWGLGAPDGCFNTNQMYM